MSYLNHAQDPRRRATALAGTVAIHAVLGIAIVTGLTISGYVNPRVYTPTVDIPLDAPPPPPPKPEQQQEQQDSIITVPPRPLDLTVPDPVDIVVEDSITDQRPFVLDPGPVIEPVADPPRPAFVPRQARPLNNPARWITNDDYPARALLEEAEGIAAYRLIVGTSGQVTACEVTRSTGNSPLDAATCRFIERRARFEPATDETGAKVVGAYTGRVKWEIPE